MTKRGKLSQRYFGALLLVFVVLGVLYSVVVPLWEAPDEPAHFGYIAHLVKKRSLPQQRPGVLDASHHPPLYYVTAALVSSIADFDDTTGAYRSNPEFIWSGKKGATDHNAALHHSAETFPYKGIALAVHLARLVSVAAGTAAVAITYAIARKIYPGHRGLALLASVLVAFNPQFLFISSSVNIDGMTAMMCTLSLWRLICALEEPSNWRGWALTGFCCGLAVLTKSSAFVVSLLAGIMLLVSAIFHRSWKLLWRGALALGLVFFLISGWWFIRNWILYGDPLGWQTFLSNWEVVRRSGKVTWPDVRAFFDVQFSSYWARFGWMTISAPEWIYRVLLTMVGLSVLGWMRWFWQRRWRSLGDGTQLGVVTLLLFPLLQEAFQIRSIFTFDASWYQGRYLFPAVASLSLIIAIGLWSLVSGWGRQVILGLFGLGLLTFAIVTPIAIIRPIYARPTLAKWRIWTLPHRSDVIFGDRIRLLGYRTHQSYSSDVREVDLTLYWQSVQDIDLNYSAFVHVTNEMGKVIAQKDVGLGSEPNYPTSAWWVGDIVPTQHSFTIPLDLPPGCEIRVGVYFWGDQKRLVAVEEGTPIGNFFIIDLSILQDAR